MSSNLPRRARLPAAVWALGFVSLFMDISSEMIHGLLPVFIVGTLGASATWLGLIEGIAEATANIVKVFSGTLSDRLGKRKSLTLLGYGLAAITKPLFPLAGSVGMVFVARFIDRIGKGIRGAPRDALISDSTPIEQRGAAFGLRQSLDTVGACAGPLLAIGLASLFAHDIRFVFWIAVVPALISVGILWLGVKEPASPSRGETPAIRLHPRELPRAFWWLCLVAGVFTLARFSEAFLVLRGADVGLPLAWTPLTLVVMNLVYMSTAYPIGRLADEMSRTRLLAIGCVILIVANVILAFSTEPVFALCGVALWGLHMGFTEGVFAAMVADSAPAHLRGTAFGVFHFMRGVLLLAASVIAGVLWDRLGPAVMFQVAAGLSATSLIAIVLVRRRLRHAAA